ncbi:MAG: hypothetical protein WDW36_006916 [Sanguina aurantia]
MRSKQSQHNVERSSNSAQAATVKGTTFPFGSNFAVSDVLGGATKQFADLSSKSTQQGAISDAAGDGRAIGNALIGDVNVVNGVFTNTLSQVKIVNTTTGQPSVSIQPSGAKSSLRSSTANASSNATHDSADYATKLRQSLRAKAAAIADYEYEAGYIESFYNGDYDEQPGDMPHHSVLELLYEEYEHSAGRLQAAGYAASLRRAGNGSSGNMSSTFRDVIAPQIINYRPNNFSIPHKFAERILPIAPLPQGPLNFTQLPAFDVFLATTLEYGRAGGYNYFYGS